MKRLLIFLNILLLSQSLNCGIISWSTDKLSKAYSFLKNNDNTITAGIGGTSIALATLVASSAIDNKKILKSLGENYIRINPEFNEWKNQNTEAGILTLLTTFLHTLNRPSKYVFTNNGFYLNYILNGAKVGLSAFLGYQAYKKIKSNLDK